jgi:hypothetical protein
MKAFISYSVNDNDQYLLTLLSSKLREKNFVVVTSQNFYSKVLDFNTQNEINDSHLFIGIITGQGVESPRVLQEWRYSQLRNIPTLLLIEDSVSINQNFNGNYIRFNRFNPELAINEINKRMSLQPTNDAVAWILGGAALLAILALLSDDKK